MTITRARIAKLRPVIAVKELSRDDLVILHEPRSRATTIATRFRDPHHRLARLFAAGLRAKDVAAKSGYSIARVASLVGDPAFQELIASYRDQVTKAFVESQDDYYETATSNMLKAERMLAEKLDEADENNELLPTRELIAISRDAADRFGYGKKQTNLNVNVDFAAKLEKAIARSGKIIDVTPSRSVGAISMAPATETPKHGQAYLEPLRRRA